MASIGDPRCSNTTVLPQLPSPNSCGLPIYQHWNATQDPLTTLQQCCIGVNGTIGFFGENSCAAYCNATQSTRGQLHDCLAGSRGISQFGCSSASSSGGAAVKKVGVWDAVVVMGLGLLVFGY